MEILNKEKKVNAAAKHQPNILPRLLFLIPLPSLASPSCPSRSPPIPLRILSQLSNKHH